MEKKTCLNCLAWEASDPVIGTCRRHAPDIIPREEWPETHCDDFCCEWIARNQDSVDDFLRGTLMELLTRFVASQIQVGEAVVPVLKMRQVPDREPEKGGGREN